MRLLQGLSETYIGRALIAYFFDLPRWTLVNVIFAIWLVPAYLALIGGLPFFGLAATLLGALVIAAMINMAAAQTVENVPRWRDVMRYPATYGVAFVLWLVVVILLIPILLFNLPLPVVFGIGIILFSVLLIGVYALFVPALLRVSGRLIGHNALVLAVHNPFIGLGMIALAFVAVCVIWWSRGALIVVMPSLWVMIVSFSIAERIAELRAKQV